VPFEHHFRQINYVRTIACEVVDVLQEVSWKNGLNFQLFFTGQSLGSSLDQITAFIIQYLIIKKNS
jgi:predicted heme/steroid binding protein